MIDGETGFAYLENNPENLGEAMRRAFDVYDDKTRIREMQQAAIEKIETEHTWKRVMQTYVGLYKKSRLDNVL